MKPFPYAASYPSHRRTRVRTTACVIACTVALFAAFGDAKGRTRRRGTASWEVSGCDEKRGGAASRLRKAHATAKCSRTEQPLCRPPAKHHGQPARIGTRCLRNPHEIEVMTSELNVPATPRDGLIERAHQRSEALGLTRGERRDFDPLVRSDLAVARERNRRLCLHAAPVMHLLFEQIVNTQSMIVLTDAQGTILHSVGDDDFLQRAQKVALAPGENWAEHSKGTNAIGTALFEEAPTLVHANEHYMLPRGSKMGDAEHVRKLFASM